jgi:protein-tyrosine phosphatase
VGLAARPRGGDWLIDEIADWKRLVINTVLSLLTPQEVEDLDLRDEANESQAQGLEFLSLPIPDRQVPRSEAGVREVVDNLTQMLSAGRNVLVHCRQGVGRTGLIAACLLVRKGMSPGAAVERISAVRGVAIPETSEQRDWIDHYAAAFAK